MGASLSIEAETKSAGIKLAISRLSDEYLSFVEITTVEVSARKDEVLFLVALGNIRLLFIQELHVKGYFTKERRITYQIHIPNTYYFPPILI